MCVVESADADRETQEQEELEKKSGAIPMKHSFDDWWKDLQEEKKTLKHEELAKMSGRKK